MWKKWKCPILMWMRRMSAALSGGINANIYLYSVIQGNLCIPGEGSQALKLSVHIALYLIDGKARQTTILQIWMSPILRRASMAKWSEVQASNHLPLTNVLVVGSNPSQVVCEGHYLRRFLTVSQTKRKKKKLLHVYIKCYLNAQYIYVWHVPYKGSWLSG